MNWLNEAELPILWWIRENLTNPFLDTVMPYITSLARHGEFWILLALILLCFKKTRKAGVAMGIAMALGFLVGNIGLKNIIARTRPYDMVEVEVLVKHLSDFSFPSGHTLVSFNAAIALHHYHRKWGVAALALATVIALSRLYLFVHYPTDVVAGFLLALVLAFASCRLVDWLWSRKKA